MDNFEWGSYEYVCSHIFKHKLLIKHTLNCRRKYGLIHVDFNSRNRTRTWKKSAAWYQNLTNSRTLDD